MQHCEQENKRISICKAIEIDGSNSIAHSLLSSIYTFQNKYELAINEAERAIELIKKYEMDVTQFDQVIRCSECDEENPKTFDICWQCHAALAEQETF